ncbi:MAG: hypothetical protein Q8P84_04475 [Deltaproteobacteria bacterium]|nr:hypothetical protein [Deltaproteobacteria bacterium]
MTHIRKTSNVVTLGRTGSKSSAGSSSSAKEPDSPFASGSVNPLRGITERKSRGLTEEQRLALLQNALKSFATEARQHLPKDVGDIEKKVREKIVKEGLSEVIANEAADEAAGALLAHRRVTRKKPT